MAQDETVAAVAAPSQVRAGGMGAAVAALLGALGSGLTFAQIQGFLAASRLSVDTYWLSADFAWPRLLPVVAVSALALSAWLAGRWGWLVATSGLAVHLAVVGSPLARSLAWDRYLGVLAVTGGAAVGGALAAFGVADRMSRCASQGDVSVRVAG
jgi:hypothetical protein